MRINYKSELKIWSAYFAAIIFAVFVHELGHCSIAWYHGIKAIPTPAKAYYGNVSLNLNNAISLGGIAGTVTVSLLAITVFVFSKFNFKSIVLAASLASPGLYSFLFLLKGRGHDSTEFQEAQSALGAAYSGHFTDWLFVSLVIIGFTIWLIRSKPGVKTIPRIVIGIFVSIVFLAALQDLNNKIFDSLLN